MAKCALFVTTLQQKENALDVLSEMGLNMPVYLTHPLSVEREAMELVRKNNIQVIIARGGVALAFRECTDLPIVDTVITVQELGMLMVQAKAMLKIERPRIAIIGYSNMLCDLSDIDFLFGIELRTYLVSNLEEMEPCTRRAFDEGADLAIGGIYVKAACEQLGLPYMDNPAGRASYRHVLQIASSVAYTIDLQQRTNLERNTLLNFSFNGIIKLDNSGKIITMNHSAESLFDTSVAEVLGQHISQIIPSIDTDRLDTEVFGDGSELFFTFWNERDAIATSIAPILVDGKTDAAIVSCYDVEKMARFEKEARLDLYSGAARREEHSYKWLTGMTYENTPFIKSLNNYTQYDECILLLGPHSIERQYCANFIHTNSLRRDLPFIELSAAAYTHAQQLAMFSDDGETLAVNGGTLFIDEVEKLCPECQHRLSYLIAHKRLTSRPTAKYLDLRLVIGTRCNLYEKCKSGEFSWDLYYAINAITLEIPPLKGCANEISNWANFYINKYCEAYGRYIMVTKTSRRIISAQPWSGGHAELRSFCKKVAIEITKRVLDEANTARILKLIAFEEQPPATTPDENSPEKDRIILLIEKHNGNRALIAEELGISKPTLWRRMTKYELL